MKNKIKYLERFSKRIGCELSLDGEIGFGRDCVGILKGKQYLGYELKASYGAGKRNENSSLYPGGDIEDVYHKGNYFAVLGHGDDAIEQLFKWVRQFDYYELVIMGFYPPMPTLGSLMGDPFEPELIIKE